MTSSTRCAAKPSWPEALMGERQLPLPGFRRLPQWCALSWNAPSNDSSDATSVLPSRCQTCRSLLSWGNMPLTMPTHGLRMGGFWFRWQLPLAWPPRKADNSLGGSVSQACKCQPLSGQSRLSVPTGFASSASAWTWNKTNKKEIKSNYNLSG